MIQELIYTSLESGLLPGTRGFSTVAMTTGLSTPTRQLLESLSGYTHIYTGHDADYLKNPVAWSHLRTQQGDSILSRVAAHDFDYTGRTNKLAHHWLISGERQFPVCGPTKLLRVPNAFCEDWTSSATYLEKDRITLSGFQKSAEPSPRATVWSHTKVGEKGAAVLAQFFKNMRKDGLSAPQPAYVIFDPEDQQTDMLALVTEASALLTPAERWQVTFSTYFTSIPIGMRCDWRFCLQGDLNFVRQRDRALWIDLSSGTINNANFDYDQLLHAAKTGQRPHISVAPSKVKTKLIDIDLTSSPSVGRKSYRLRDTQPSQPDPLESTPLNLPEPKQQKKIWFIVAAVAVIGVAVIGALVLTFTFRKREGKQPTASVSPSIPSLVPTTLTNQTTTSNRPVAGGTNVTDAAKSPTNAVPATTKHADAPPPQPSSKENVPSSIVSKAEQPREKGKSASAAKKPPKKTDQNAYNYISDPNVLENDVFKKFANKDEATAPGWSFYGIREKGIGEWVSEQGEFIPRYNSTKGEIQHKFILSNKAEPNQNDYIVLLFEDDTAGLRYLYIKDWSAINITPSVVNYPTTRFPIKETKNIALPLITAFNKLECFSGKVYVGDGANSHPLQMNIPPLKISEASVLINYISTFEKTIETNPQVLPKGSKYVIWLADLKAASNNLINAESIAKTQKEPLEKKIENSRRFYDEKKKELNNKVALPKEKISQKERDNCRGELASREVAMKEEEIEFKKQIEKCNEPVQAKVKAIKDLQNQKNEKLKSLEDNVVITLTLIPAGSQPRQTQ